MEKEIHIFDTMNRVLKVPGIRFELFDVNSGVLFATDITRDLGFGEWGVRLQFVATSGPLEVYTTDPNHRYPGNVIKNLEGQNSNRIDIDLGQTPAADGGQHTILQSSSANTIYGWVESATRWNDEEKSVVRNLIFNYLKLSGDTRAAKEKKGLVEVMTNWEEELERLGVNFWSGRSDKVMDSLTADDQFVAKLLQKKYENKKNEEPEAGA
jgi:hypothetical protein